MHAGDCFDVICTSQHVTAAFFFLGCASMGWGDELEGSCCGVLGKVGTRFHV